MTNLPQWPFNHWGIFLRLDIVKALTPIKVPNPTLVYCLLRQRPDGTAPTARQLKGFL